jgi:hypothetical protein
MLFNNASGQRSLFNQKYEALSTDFQLSESELEQYRNEGKLEIFNSEKHKTKLAKQLLKMRSGRSKKIDRGYYKNIYRILSKQDIKHYRVRYIYIDQSKFDSNEKLQEYLKKVRDLLEETAFKSVAMQYSMDYKKNVGGDSGWFKEAKTEPLFFKQVSATNRLAEEIFEFEIPENKAYYFVQKTHAPTDIEEVLVLQTKED